MRMFLIISPFCWGRKDFNNSRRHSEFNEKCTSTGHAITPDKVSLGFIYRQWKEAGLPRAQFRITIGGLLYAMTHTKSPSLLFPTSRENLLTSNLSFCYIAPLIVQSQGFKLTTTSKKNTFEKLKLSPTSLLKQYTVFGGTVSPTEICFHAVASSV